MKKTPCNTDLDIDENGFSKDERDLMIGEACDAHSIGTKTADQPCDDPYLLIGRLMALFNDHGKEAVLDALSYIQENK